MRRRSFLQSIAAGAALGIGGRRMSAEASEAPTKRFLKVQDNGYFAFEDGEAFLPLGGFYGNFVHRVEEGQITSKHFYSIRESV